MHLGGQWRLKRLDAVTITCLSLMLLALTGSAAPNGAADKLLKLQKIDQRVADIGWKLATQNLELCPKQFAATGITLHTLAQYNSDWRSAALTAFKFSPDKPGVLAVAFGSPAWNAGLRNNDVIVSFNGSPMTVPSPTPNLKGNYDVTDAAMNRIEEIPASKEISIGIQRGDRYSILTFVPVTACASRFEVATTNVLNANSNGHVVQLYGKLVVEIPNDNELALVMGHELAHNVLGHSQEIRRRKLSGGLFAGFGKSGEIVRRFELHADRLGIFFTARAGFDYGIAPQFWRRFSSKGGFDALIPTTHPSPKTREKNARQAVNEIDDLKSFGKPLVPVANVREMRFTLHDK